MGEKCCFVFKLNNFEGGVRVRISRVSYMNANVLLSLLNELGKGDKMGGLPIILSLFRN